MKLPQLITPAIQKMVHNRIAELNRQNSQLTALDKLAKLTAEAIKTSAEIDKILKGKGK